MKLVAALLALSSLVSCSGSSPSVASPSVAPPSTLGRAERFSIGALEAYALADGHLDVPNDGTLLAFGRPPAETADVLAAAGLPTDTIRVDIQCLLVRAGDRVVLFDTGLGAYVGSFDAGHLPRSLAKAHVQPSAITDIFISHAHTDHVGGLVTREGALAFPAATIHMSAPEWAAMQAETDDDSRRFVATVAPRVAPFEPGAQVLPSVKAVATPGHTPGHSSYLIGSGADALFYLGDLAHHPVISVEHPTWQMAVDGDHAAAGAMRQQQLAALAASGTRVFAFHFPFPGLGRVTRHGQGFMWRPDAPPSTVAVPQRVR